MSFTGTASLNLSKEFYLLNNGTPNDAPWVYYLSTTAALYEIRLSFIEDSISKEDSFNFWTVAYNSNFKFGPSSLGLSLKEYWRVLGILRLTMGTLDCSLISPDSYLATLPIESWDWICSRLLRSSSPASNYWFFSFFMWIFKTSLRLAVMTLRLDSLHTK